MISTLFITAIIFAGLYIYFSRKNKNNSLPGPWNLPIIGYLHLLDPEKPHLTLKKLADKYGPIFRLKFGVMNTVVISEAKLLKKVLMQDECNARPPLYVVEYMCQGRGFTFVAGNLWKDQRKLISNFLRSVTKMSPKKEEFEQQINVFIDEFIKHVNINGDDVSVLDPSEAITHFVSCVSGVLFLGKASLENNACVKLVHELDDVTKLVTLAGALNFLPFLRFVPMLRKQLESIDTAKSRYMPIQTKLIEACRTFPKDSSLIQDFFSRKDECNSEEIYSMEQLQVLLADVFAASTETTITSIKWIILHLAAFPQVQERVRQELREVVQRRRVDLDDLLSLPYTQATLAEIGRFTTIVPMGTPRYTLEDLHVENYTIPKNTMILPLLYAIHMDFKWWVKPEEFCPERFLDGRGNFVEPEAFMPFQSGKRICVGRDLANFTIFLLVTNLLQHFKIESCSSIDFSGACGATFVPKPHRLIFRKL